MPVFSSETIYTFDPAPAQPIAWFRGSQFSLVVLRAPLPARPLYTALCILTHAAYMQISVRVKTHVRSRMHDIN